MADSRTYFQNYVHHIDHDNNMGLVRYVLAFGVLIAHFNELCGGNIPWLISSYNSVGGFFVLSGFVLIGGQLKGRSFRGFAERRLWRILPSYFAVVIFFSILLSLFSDLSAGAYFGSKEYWKYLLCNVFFMNFLCPTLPGVFDGIAVNGSLWTMKVELQLSFSLPVILWLTRRYRLNLMKVLVFFIVSSVLYRFIFSYLYMTTESKIYEILGRQFVGQSMFFCLGMILFCKLDFVMRYKKQLALLAALLYVCTLTWSYDLWYQLSLQPVIISLLVITFSLFKGNFLSRLDRGHNISYEIYLSHAPVLLLLNQYNVVEKYGSVVGLMMSIFFTILISILIYNTVGNLYLRKSFKAR